MIPYLRANLIAIKKNTVEFSSKIMTNAPWNYDSSADFNLDLTAAVNSVGRPRLGQSKVDHPGISRIGP